MVNNNYKILVEKLIESTKENKLIWQKSIRQNGFCTDISTFQFEIILLSSGSFTIGTEKKDDYQLSIINEDGDYIDCQDVNSTDQDYSKMVSLYTEARRSYYKVDEVIQALINEL